MNPQDAAIDPAMASPKHGFRGESDTAAVSEIPLGLTIAVSREAGSRGGTIGRRVAQELGWQVYDHEMIEYLSQQGNLLDEMPAGQREIALQWVANRIQHLQDDLGIVRREQLEQAARAPLCLAAMGNGVLIGRGAGFLLPVETTLHVRMVAPLHDRVAYLGQWLRLTAEEAMERALHLDRRRAEFLDNALNLDLENPHHYDLVLCSTRLGEDLCVSLIHEAARNKIERRWGAKPKKP